MLCDLAYKDIYLAGQDRIGVFQLPRDAEGDQFIFYMVQGLPKEGALQLNENLNV